MHTFQHYILQRVLKSHIHQCYLLITNAGINFNILLEGGGRFNEIHSLHSHDDETMFNYQKY
jgi:hypothetical protein